MAHPLQPARPSDEPYHIQLVDPGQRHKVGDHGLECFSAEEDYVKNLDGRYEIIPRPTARSGFSQVPKVTIRNRNGVCVEDYLDCRKIYKHEGDAYIEIPQFLPNHPRCGRPVYKRVDRGVYSVSARVALAIGAPHVSTHSPTSHRSSQLDVAAPLAPPFRPTPWPSVPQQPAFDVPQVPIPSQDQTPQPSCEATPHALLSVKLLLSNLERIATN